jgi:hypothetical protein
LVEVSERDVRSEPECHERSALTIIHPPYFNAYRYSSINSFEMAWLGIIPRDVRRHEIREAFKTASIEKVDRYVHDMVDALTHTAAVTRPGGVVGLMIGDTILRGEYLPIVRAIVEGLPSTLSLREVALRVPRHTEATWVASQRRNGREIGTKLYDFVLTFTVAD